MRGELSLELSNSKLKIAMVESEMMLTARDLRPKSASISVVDQWRRAV